MHKEIKKTSTPHIAKHKQEHCNRQMCKKVDHDMSDRPPSFPFDCGTDFTQSAKICVAIEDSFGDYCADDQPWSWRVRWRIFNG